MPNLRHSQWRRDSRKPASGKLGAVQVLPFGVDTASWSAPLTEAGAGLVARLRSAHPQLVVTIGQLVPHNGIDVLIEAMRNIDAHLLIVGDGPRRNWLQAQIDDNELGDRVTLWGSASHFELRAILAATDVFALPSLMPSETFGIVQLEAMACGLPIVNTALPTSASWMARDRREAITVIPDSAIALSNAIRVLLTDRRLAGRLGTAGRTRATRTFALSTFEDRVTQIYNQVIAARKQSVGEACLPLSAMTEAELQ